jgi:hypothetical protein
MFQSSVKRIRALASLFDDVLGDPQPEPAPHPHRRPLRWDKDRRSGAVSPREAHCVSPVRASAAIGKRDQAIR